MRKHLLFLAVALAMCGTPLLTSCDKDEPTPMDVAKKNVANTQWIGADRYLGASTIKFKGDGTFEIDVDNSALSYAKGTYTQSGTTIKFNVISDWAFWYDFYEGTISYGGGTLTVPMYYYDGSKAYDASFTLNVLK